MKQLHKFTIEVEKEVEKSETKEENGQKIVTTQKVKEKVSIEFLIRKPTRSEKEEAEIIRATYLSAFIRRGVMPEAVLAKTYSDQGGIMDKIDKEYYDNLTSKLSKKIEEFQNLTLDRKDENNEASEKCLKEIIDLRQEITDFQLRQSSFFQNTAEYKAKAKLIEYLFTLLTEWKPESNKNFESYFKGKNFEEKINSLEKMEDNDDEIYNKMKDKALFVISLFLHSGGAISEQDVNKIVEENFNAR